MRYRMRTLHIFLGIGPPLLLIAWVYFPLLVLAFVAAASVAPIFVVAAAAWLTVWRRKDVDVRRVAVLTAIAVVIWIPAALLMWGSDAFSHWVETAVMP